MFAPKSGPEGWPKLPDEMTQLALCQDWLDHTAATLKRLREIVIAVPLAENERQLLLYQLGHIWQHLDESVNSLAANVHLRNN